MPPLRGPVRLQRHSGGWRMDQSAQGWSKEMGNEREWRWVKEETSQVHVPCLECRDGMAPAAETCYLSASMLCP